MAKTDNFEVDEKNNTVLVSINPKIYPIEVIFSASYMLLDKAFVVIDGDPGIQVVVSLRPRNKEKLDQLARSFNDQLLNYAVNNAESKKTEKLREEIIKQAFTGHSKEG